MFYGEKRVFLDPMPSLKFKVLKLKIFNKIGFAQLRTKTNRKRYWLQPGAFSGGGRGELAPPPPPEGRLGGELSIY